MAFALAPEAIAAGYRLLAFDTIGSTNEEAAARGRAGETGPLWIVSPHQSGGRGRRGGSWQTPSGNLAASLLLTTEVPPAVAATLGFVAGLALAQALDRCCGRDIGRGSALDLGSGAGRFLLKWPNDVLVEGAKLSGILLETEQRADLSRFLVIGIGVNTAHAPQGVPYPATSLVALGHHVEPATLFRALSSEWVALMDLWAGGRGFPAIRQLWLQRAAGLGRDILVQTGRESLRGTFETLDDTGQLVVRLDDGSSRLVTAGDVHFGIAATGRAAAITGAGEAGVVA
jgi:BirA family transcriptional regulator, biotin operon repressor / biotin---[acetyl-CoA-carboxylase] ligase